MGTRRTSLLALLSALLTVGCATPFGVSPIAKRVADGILPPPRSLPSVTDLTTRLDFPGFSILPPQGQFWFISQKDRYGIVFGKPRGLVGTPIQGSTGPAYRAHTFVAVAVGGYVRGVALDSPERLQQLIERALQSEGRFRLVSSQAAPDTSRGTDCVRYAAVVEERDNPRTPGFILTVTENGVVCRHPDSPEFVVRILYSERYVQGQEPRPSLAEVLKPEVEPFLASLIWRRLEP